MKRSEFEHLLCTAGALSPEKEFIVFGSQALLSYVEKPPKALLVSLELDLYPKNRPEVVPRIEAVLGRGSEFARTHAYYADCVTPDLGTRPEGWIRRLIRFEKNGVIAWCAKLHDVAVSKLAAARPKDIRYLQTLFRHKLISEQTLRKRIKLVPDPPTQERLNHALQALLKQPVRATQTTKPKPRPRKS